MTLDRRTVTKTALIAWTVVALAPRGGLAQQQAPGDAPGAGGGLEEIVVTASKREEKLENVPASITALSAADLSTQGVTDFSDYMTLVPSMADFSGGSEGHGAIILRGLNTGYYQTSNTVGYYIDDIPFSATSPLSVGALLTLDPDLSDIDHLEVLKGPQATLYGASTLGGLIKVVTKSRTSTATAARSSSTAAPSTAARAATVWSASPTLRSSRARSPCAPRCSIATSRVT